MGPKFWIFKNKGTKVVFKSKINKSKILIPYNQFNMIITIVYITILLGLKRFLNGLRLTI